MAFTLTGVSSMKSKLLGTKPGMLRSTMQALNVEAEKIMTRSKREFVFVDEGTLRNTGHVIHAELIGDMIVVLMRYGPIVTAIVLHEFPDFNPRHWPKDKLNPTKPGTGPKYLERPLREAVSGMAERIAHEIRL